MKRLRWLLLVVALGAVFVVWRRVKPANTDVPTVRVTKRKVTQKIVADGTLMANKVTPISTPQELQSALKVDWMVENGSMVEKDQVVVRLDAREIRASLDENHDNASSLAAKLKKEQLETELAKQKQQWTSEVAQKELELKLAFSQKDPDINSKQQIIEAEIDEEIAKARFAHAKEIAKLESKLAINRAQLLAIEKRGLDLEISSANKSLQGLEVKAPHAGIVELKTWRKRLKVGDQVWAGQPIGEIPNTSELEVKAFVLEADVGGLKEGLTAEISILAHPQVPLSAKITKIDKVARKQDNGNPVQYLGVTLAVEKVLPIMKIGQRVTVTIAVPEEDAVWVPRHVVFEKENQFYVYKMVGGKLLRSDVKLGASSGGMVAISEGLLEGDSVALRDPSAKRQDDKEKEDKQEDVADKSPAKSESEDEP